MKKFLSIKNITIFGMLLALVVVLQTISNYVSFGPVSITLSLIPIAVGAMIFGPIGGGLLGLIMGAFVLIAPSTQTFFQINPWATVIVCLVKGMAAGIVAGLIFYPFKKHQKYLLLGSILASISVPLVNTGLFSVGYFLWFTSIAGDNNPAYFLFILMIGWNFLLEFGVNSILSPVVYRIYQIYQNKAEKEKKL